MDSFKVQMTFNISQMDSFKVQMTFNKVMMPV